MLRFLQRYAVPSQAAPGVGYVYVIAFRGPGAYVKVGSTAAPQARLLTLYYAARSQRLQLEGLWLSPAHPDYRIIEKRALTACRAISPSATPRSEYFPGLLFDHARRETAKAAYGFRDRLFPSSWPSEMVAGQHEDLPHDLRRRVERRPPGPGDAFRIHFALQHRFAQGTARTRFLRRNRGEEQQGDLLRLPHSES
ncbi:GIY-YIG nuclease family protein [Streptomyces canus]|uniref:GIY-YIG nuclease family protein n=1 Tax=Streptomyces canus TaxID=58343 RepID=UPI0027D7D72F|nr:GIY-YIG nuclease family protein [Streptomyces canus]